MMSSRGILSETRSGLNTGSQNGIVGSDPQLSNKLLETNKTRKYLQFNEISSSLPSYNNHKSIDPVSRIRSGLHGSASDLGPSPVTATVTSDTGLMTGLRRSPLSRAGCDPPLHQSSIRRQGDVGSRSHGNHVSFLSPPVESFAELPSSATSTSSSLPYSNCQDKSTYDADARPQTRETPNISDSRDTIKSLDNIVKKDWKLNISSASTNGKSKEDEDEVSFKRDPLLRKSLVNDDILKLWEETEADNRRLMQEMARVRGELRETKYVMEKARSKASSLNVLSDIEKREKKEVKDKLNEMEGELKLLAQSEGMTDQTLNQMKGDNNRLRAENLSLIRVISKLSGGQQMMMNMGVGGPGAPGLSVRPSSYVCKHGRLKHIPPNSNLPSRSGTPANLNNIQPGFTPQMQTPGHMMGPMNGPMNGPMIGPMNGPMNVPINGPLNGPMNTPMMGPVMQPNPNGQQFPIMAPSQQPLMTPQQPLVMTPAPTMNPLPMPTMTPVPPQTMTPLPFQQPQPIQMQHPVRLPTVQYQQPRMVRPVIAYQQQPQRFVVVQNNGLVQSQPMYR